MKLVGILGQYEGNDRLAQVHLFNEEADALLQRGINPDPKLLKTRIEEWVKNRYGNEPITWRDYTYTY